MTSVDDVYGPTFLTVAFAREQQLIGKSLTIEHVDARQVGRPEKFKTKLVIRIRDVKLEYVCGKKNTQILAEKFGKDYSQWSGKQFSFSIIKTNMTDSNGNYMDGLQVVCL